MEQIPVDIPCPICKVEGEVRMMTHIDEIPYFGEHTQVTVLCNACGWRQSDFIPAEGRKPGGCKLVISKPEHIRARVVRSSSCTVRILELDLEVKPGSSSTGYVSNVEGVIDRFMDVIVMVTRQAYVEDSDMSDIKTLQMMHTTLLELKEDPNGHSQILHEDAEMRELEAEELEDYQSVQKPQSSIKTKLHDYKIGNSIPESKGSGKSSASCSIFFAPMPFSDFIGVLPPLYSLENVRNEKTRMKNTPTNNIPIGNIQSFPLVTDMPVTPASIKKAPTNR